MARNSASLESIFPADLENIARTIPLSFLNTPPMPASPGFPKIEASTLNFHQLVAGASHWDEHLTLEGFLGKTRDLGLSKISSIDLETFGHFAQHH